MGVNPNVHIQYKQFDLKQYCKEGRASRIEGTFRNTKDFYINKGLSNLPYLQKLGRQINRRLLAGCGKTPKPLVDTRGSEIGITCLQQLTELRPSGSGTAEPFPQPARTVAANTA